MPRITLLITALATVVASFALATSTATANPVEVVNEVDGTHCSLPAANCAFTVEGSWSLRDGAMNTITACHIVLTVRLDEDGSGVATSVNFEPAAGCLDVNCPAPEGNWPIQPIDEIAANEYGTELRFCLLGAGGVQRHCNLALHIEEDPVQEHHYIIMTAASHHGPESAEFFCAPAGPFLTLSNMEIDSNNIEILH